MSENLTLQIIMSCLGGLALFVSELLPFIKSVESNGLVHLLIAHAEKLIKPKVPGSITEQTPLLNDHGCDDTIIPINENVGVKQNKENGDGNGNGNLDIKLDNLSVGLTNISNMLCSCVSDFQNARQLKLQPSELYELNYIINYIKVNYVKKTFRIKYLSRANKQLLIAQGYIVDYDSHEDTNVIKW